MPGEINISWTDATWNIVRGCSRVSDGCIKDHELRPEGCDGCKEVALFLTVPGYRGDAAYPVGVDFERHW
jgi:protein gp37